MNQSTVVALRLYIIEEIINSYWRNFVKEFNLKVSKRGVNLDDWIAKCSNVERKIACKPEKTPINRRAAIVSNLINPVLSRFRKATFYINTWRLIKFHF